jgi:hypothetical protein
MVVDFSKLPIDIQRQIPLSLRSYKQVHVFEELPVTIQYLIKPYFEKLFSVDYKVSFDLKPVVSKYSDFYSIDNVSDLVVEYLKNYLLTVPESYPWDPYFGSRLKFQLQTRDNNVRQTLVTAEVNNIVKAISTQTGADIVVENVENIAVANSVSTENMATISLKINNQPKQVNINYII